jgi:uncharacterized protein
MASVNKIERSPTIVKCPSCGGKSVYASSNAYRPFCSERCKDHDLGAWASEQFRMPSTAPPDEDLLNPAQPENLH